MARRLYDVAHARAGDKGDTSSVAVFAYDPADYPAIKASLTPERVKHYLEEMDAAGVRAAVNLDGGWGPLLKETLAALDEARPHVRVLADAEGLPAHGDAVDARFT